MAINIHLNFDRFIENYAEFVRTRKEQGIEDLEVPKNYVCANGYKLGMANNLILFSYVSCTRRVKLTREQYAQITNINPSWAKSKAMRSQTQIKKASAHNQEK